MQRIPWLFSQAALLFRTSWGCFCERRPSVSGSRQKAFCRIVVIFPRPRPTLRQQAQVIVLAPREREHTTFVQFWRWGGDIETGCGLPPWLAEALRCTPSSYSGQRADVAVLQDDLLKGLSTFCRWPYDPSLQEAFQILSIAKILLLYLSTHNYKRNMEARRPNPRSDPRLMQRRVAAPSRRTTLGQRTTIPRPQATKQAASFYEQQPAADYDDSGDLGAFE